MGWSVVLFGGLDWEGWGGWGGGGGYRERWVRKRKSCGSSVRSVSGGWEGGWSSRSCMVGVVGLVGDVGLIGAWGWMVAGFGVYKCGG